MNARDAAIVINNLLMVRYGEFNAAEQDALYEAKHVLEAGSAWGDKGGRR